MIMRYDDKSEKDMDLKDLGVSQYMYNVILYQIKELDNDLKNRKITQKDHSVVLKSLKESLSVYASNIFYYKKRILEGS